MQIEIEAKFLDVDAGDLRKTLKRIGAVCAYAQHLMRRKNFDYPDRRLEKMGGWIRVRDEGDTVTLAYKRLFDRTLEGTREISVTVDDFDNACNLLLAVGLDNKSYQETKREKWEYDGVEITLDTWPWIPAFVEIEALSEEKLKEAANKLGLDWARALHGSVEVAYQKYYNVTEHEIDGWERITFTPVPEWLEIKRKKYGQDR